MLYTMYSKFATFTDVNIGCLAAFATDRSKQTTVNYANNNIIQKEVKKIANLCKWDSIIRFS